MVRRKASTDYQLELPSLSSFKDSSLIIAGVDEVGRGALFGPVVAAAIILPDSALHALEMAGVTDSKLLSASQRQRLAVQIRSFAVAHQIGYASVREIDRLNILQASLLAMKRAILRLSIQPNFCLIDGNQRIPELSISQEPLVKGDQKSIVIAAASIIAKVWRDELLTRMALRYPQYGLATNKGYGTAIHRQAILKYGITPYHRKSFSPCRLTLSEHSPNHLSQN
ncbi:ribonuclease HII [Phormidium sp. CLA17]|uniref:ribonuclease HII n=1 Tax=Leptolyngbya sp. Cla-17 TaxID=2803751 RepID=UPI00149126A8|nr:ribonuclease HII [Leptolyngbya sp. Cla-17]MBM0741054.1 ribonuclease HII [Leptolyngbya sp. Cla-17]